MHWKWSNVPIPEAYVVALMAGMVPHLLAPLRMFSMSGLGHAWDGLWLWQGFLLSDGRCRH
jgi:hypothetical protein